VCSSDLAKFTVTDLFASIVIAVGLVEPLAPPLQLEKAYPEFAVAVNVTLVPAE
jgi:hypothetical protein